MRLLVVGGIAVAAHAEPRFTKALDVLVEASLANGRRLHAALVDFGFGAVAPHPSELAKAGPGWLLGRIPVYGRDAAVDSARRLPASTSDGFVLHAMPTGGLPMIVFRLTHAGNEIARFEADEVRAYGFSPDERVMVIAESSGLIVLSR